MKEKIVKTFGVILLIVSTILFMYCFYLCIVEKHLIDFVIGIILFLLQELGITLAFYEENKK